MTDQGLPRVVIIGAGFGGLEAAKALGRAPVDLTIIDRQNYHCFQPLLYQVATAALSPADVAWPIRHILARQRNATVLMEEVRAIDTNARIVVTDAIKVPYDHLIIATGATHTYFTHPEWEAVAPGLKRIEDATLIRRRILVAFEKAELAADDSDRRRLLTFVIVGGGPTGVELAGAIAEVAHETLPPEFRRIDPRCARILLIEAGPRLLPALPDKLSAYAEKALRAMGVEVFTSSPVTDCNDQGVEVGNRRIESETIVWAAGVVASPIAAWLGTARDRAGRVPVNPDLSVPGLPHVYVIGDAAAVGLGPNQFVPGLAAAAKQMGRHVGRCIAANSRGDASPGPFRYHHQGDLATVGRRAAVVKLKHLQLTGFIGWLFWSAAHVYFLIGARSRFVVAFSWAWQYLTFQRGARLITEEKQSSVRAAGEYPRAAGRSSHAVRAGGGST